MVKNKKNYFNFFVALVACLSVRLLPFRMPNIEPIMATVMPFSKVYGAVVGFSFAVLSILSYDLFTDTLGIQTFFTIFAYGAIGLYSAFYFKKNEANISNFVKFSIVGTLFYDAFTGLTVGPLFFNQSFLGSLIGQVPFTLFHLIGNTVFAVILSPAIYKLLIKKKEKEKTLIINSFNPKTI